LISKQLPLTQINSIGSPEIKKKRKKRKKAERRRDHDRKTKVFLPKRALGRRFL